MVQSVLETLTVRRSKREVLDEMKVELYNNIDEYTNFINTLETDPVEEMERYISSGKYTSNLADLVIPILTKVLNIRIVVVQFDNDEQAYKIVNKDLHVFKANDEFEETVYLQFSGDHYDTLITINIISFYIMNQRYL